MVDTIKQEKNKIYNKELNLSYFMRWRNIVLLILLIMLPNSVLFLKILARYLDEFSTKAKNCVPVSDSSAVSVCS